MSNYFSHDWIATLATNLLATAARTLAGTERAPQRVVLAFGKQPIRDCNQLALTVQTITPIRPSFGRRGGLARDPGPVEPVGLIPSIAMLIELIGCGGPTITGTVAPVLPSAADITAWSQALLTDGWTLYRGLIVAQQAGLLYADPT